MGDAIHVRMYRDEDMPAVLELLRASLGEPALLQRTEQLFRWKHIDNPFGHSVILVAEIDDTIVGLRAFMRWQLAHGGDLIECGRAVDTATHPSYQRQGIFKRLTMEAIEVARDVGLQVIFNTPNERSRPGYLKMGWSDVGPIHVLIRPHPARLLRARRASFPKLDELAPSATPIEPDWRLAGDPADDNVDAESTRLGLQTPRSSRYLIWRFAMHPTARYGALTRSSGTAVVRPNLRNGRTELVVSDVLGTSPSEAVRTAVRESKADYEVAVFPPGSPGRHAVQRAGMLPVPGVVALRLVARPIDPLDIDLLNAKSWRLTLSDLELL